MLLCNILDIMVGQECLTYFLFTPTDIFRKPPMSQYLIDSRDTANMAHFHSSGNSTSNRTPCFSERISSLLYQRRH